LYNLHDDPGEQHDLAAANPDKVRDLAARLDAWRAEVKAVMPAPNPKGAGKADATKPIGDGRSA
jgi:arylsulfatase A